MHVVPHRGEIPQSGFRYTQSRCGPNAGVLKVVRVTLQPTSKCGFHPGYEARPCTWQAKMDGETAYMFDKILDDIAQDTKPVEPIFTFPAMPMFNFITGHPQPTFAPVHYWNVCPDAVAEADMERVKAAKPAVIVDMDLPEWQWQIVELAFRNGKRSAQRDMEALIKQFVDSGDYRLQDTFLTPWTHIPVNVWHAFTNPELSHVALAQNMIALDL